MRILIVEDEFISRQIMQDLLEPYGECDLAVTGKEALLAFKLALEKNKRYDLIMLDIMLPEMDGQTVLKEIRKIEEEHNILGLDGVKIIMTTALGDFKNVSKAFNYQCEGYLVKPIDEENLVNMLKKLKLI